MSISRLSQPKYLLIFICLLFLFTRFYRIVEIPASVYWDEASIGYNAYSISQTGKDEWGKVFPLHFRAFGEFKLPVYIYTTAFSVSIFGLNELAVRFPAVIFSLGTLILTYFLTKKLISDREVGLLASFLICISPWFFIFSRTGYEVTAGLFFYLLGLYLFLKQSKNTWFIFFSAVSFIFSLYSYNSFRVTVPITILILALYEIKNIKKSFLPIILSVVFLSISIIPIYRLYVFDAGISRLQAVRTQNSAFIKNFLSHFSFNFLFAQGDKNLRSQQNGFGELYLPELILLPMGMLYLIKLRTKYIFLPAILLLIGIVPAAITKEFPHALRSIAAVPFFCMISAFGIAYLKNFVKVKYLTLLIVSTFLVFFINYFISFLKFYPYQSAKDWQYGYKQVTRFDFTNYNQVIISDEYAQPYIFTLFYLKYDPNKFRQEVLRNNTDEWGFSTVSSFNKFKFGKANKLFSSNLGSSLIFASNKDKISNLSPVGVVNLLDGNTAFWVYQQ